MWRAANAVISGLVIVSIIVVVLGMLVVSGILLIGHHDAKTTLMFQLLRVMFPYVLLVCLTAILMGMLNARGHFFIPALGAATLNVVMIASVVFLTPLFGTEVQENERRAISR
jgi:putative peptidoglycan lipid II flippase